MQYIYIYIVGYYSAIKKMKSCYLQYCRWSSRVVCYVIWRKTNAMWFHSYMKYKIIFSKLISTAFLPLEMALSESYLRLIPCILSVIDTPLYSTIYLFLTTFSFQSVNNDCNIYNLKEKIFNLDSLSVDLLLSPTSQ